MYSDLTCSAKSLYTCPTRQAKERALLMTDHSSETTVWIDAQGFEWTKTEWAAHAEVEGII